MLPPLTLDRVADGWTFSPPVVAGLVVLAGGYAWGVAQCRAQGRPWPGGRTAWWVAGVVLLALVGTSVIATYDDVLFWTRAVQGVVLLVVAPMLLAAGAPLTLAQETLPGRWRQRLGRVRRGGAARALTHPGMVTLLLILPPFVIYLTGLHRTMTGSAVVGGAVSVALLACGFVYAASRLQIDPMPRRTQHGLTLVIALAEILADGVLGLVLWLGPLIAVHDPGQTWGPDPRTDQVIGAGVWWLGGDVAGLPFLLAIMARFAAADDAQARVLDRELDAAEPPGGGADGPDDAAGPDDEAAAARRRALWWQDDPYLAARYRRR